MKNKVKVLQFKLLSNLKKDARDHLIYKSLFFSLLAQGINILIGFLLVPVTLGYLNKDRYGIWLTLISVISWIYVLDVGLGNGLRNKLTESVADNDFIKAKGYISSTYFFLGIISILTLVIFLPVCFVVNWNSLLNISSISSEELLFTTIILVSFFSFHFLLKLIGTIYTALQKPYITQYLSLAINAINLILIICIKNYFSQSLLPIAIVLGISQLLVYLFYSIYSFYGPLKDFRPEVQLIRKEYFKPLFSMGIKFFIIQVSGVLMFTTSNIIISKFSAPSFVVEYNLANKYLSVSNILFGFILMPYWSAFTDAFSRKEYAWIDRSLSRLIKLWMYSNILIVFMVIISPFFYHIWLGDKIVISFMVTLFTGFYFISMNVSSIYNTLLNGMGIINYNFKLAIIQLLLFYPLIYLFQLLFDKITLSILSTMILNMMVSSILLKNQYNKIKKNFNE